MSRLLIIIGLAIAAAGVLWPLLVRSGLGRLPGDVLIQRGSFTFYAPVMTCVLLSIVLTLIFWLFGR